LLAWLTYIQTFLFNLQTILNHINDITFVNFKSAIFYIKVRGFIVLLEKSAIKWQISHVHTPFSFFKSNGGSLNEAELGLHN
jgi:hypothetical protein